VSEQVALLLRYAGNVLIHWAALVGVASVVVHSRVRWWDSPMGRHLMAYMTVIAAVLVLSVIRIDTGDTWWFGVLRLVVFAGVPVVMTQRLWLQIQAQRADRGTNDVAEQ
jgi:FtsH-binding integral membrane protein